MTQEEGRFRSCITIDKSFSNRAKCGDNIQNKLNELSNATDSLELWVKVQLLWTSLESVFMGGDIAKQMPIDAKKFVKIDKDWAKIMTKGGFVNR